MGHLATLSTSLMQEYICRPSPILAVQITDDNAKDIALMVNGKLYPRDRTTNLRIYFHCCNGRQKAEWSDWILKDSRGFHSMTHSEFTSTYQEKQ